LVKKSVTAEHRFRVYGRSGQFLSPDRFSIRHIFAGSSGKTDMRVETNADGTSKCWMTEDEYHEFRRAAETTRDNIIVRLGGEVGLRAFEIPQVQPRHVRRTGDGEHYRLRVPEGKDTADGQGKARDAYLPRSVETDLHRYATENEVDDAEPFIDLEPRSVRYRVDQVAERAAELTGDRDYYKVSSHDLRRRFAQRLLVDEGMNPRVVMAVGGWSDFSAIEPYLNQPTESVINEAFETVGV
jgi:integrase